MMLWLTCTHGRYQCLQRNLKCFLDQVFDGEAVMFICNSGAPLRLPADFVLPVNKKIYIDNCALMDFQSVGEKYTHALKLAKHLFPQIKIVCSQDDDDIFLPNHLQQGYTKLMEFSDTHAAYKPQFSYYRYRNGEHVNIKQMENTFEPSIFVTASWLEEYGYAPVSIKYHQQWLDPLIEAGKIYVDPAGESTLIYNWGDSWGTYKMSGNPNDNYQNFLAHKRNSIDMGTGILYPALDNSQYYSLKNLVN